MDSGKEEQKIKQLKEMKQQLRWWKSGLFFAGVVVAMATIGTVQSSVAGLVEDGPRQKEFVKEMTRAFKSDIAPAVEDLARQTVNEVRPEIQASFERVNARLPELAQASLKELDVLQANLPKRGEAVLQQTFGQMLVKKEAKLLEMFPEATEEQIERLLTNLGDSAGNEAGAAAVELFGRHHEVLQRIHEHLSSMSAKEKNLDSVDPSWEMGLLVLDLFREDLHNRRPDKAAATEQMASAKSEVKSAIKAAPAKASAKKSEKKYQKVAKK